MSATEEALNSPREAFMWALNKVRNTITRHVACIAAMFMSGYSPNILWWPAKFECRGNVLESAHTPLRPAILWVECGGFSSVAQADINIDMSHVRSEPQDNT
jgi:hypothetical protein